MQAAASRRVSLTAEKLKKKQSPFLATRDLGFEGKRVFPLDGNWPHRGVVYPQAAIRGDGRLRIRGGQLVLPAGRERATPEEGIDFL